MKNCTCLGAWAGFKFIVRKGEGEMKVKEINREEIEQEMYEEESGYKGWIEVVESQTIDGCFVNAAGVSWIKLDDENFAYRTEAESQDGNWDIGKEKDVIGCAEDFKNYFEEEEEEEA